MLHTKVRFCFEERVPLEEAGGTLELAKLAVESLYGVGRTALETHCRIDPSNRVFVIDTSTEVGRNLALIFGGYVEREFGVEAVQMRRVEEPSTQTAGAAV